jgi:hypothetical protein
MAVVQKGFFPKLWQQFNALTRKNGTRPPASNPLPLCAVSRCLVDLLAVLRLTATPPFQASHHTHHTRQLGT